MPMKNVLIVDDEKMFLLSLSEGLSSYAKDFNVLTAGDGQEALDVLKTTKVDIIVTDIKMPVMDGYELLAHMSKQYKDVAVLVMTAFGAPEVEEKLKTLGVNQYVDKPLDYRDLAGRIIEQLEAISQGYIHGVTLSTFIKLVEMDHKTCAFRVTSGKSVGFIYFVKGGFLDARTEELEGEAAYNVIMSWNKPGIEIDSISKTKEKEKDQLQFVLREFSENSSQTSKALGFQGIYKKRVD